MTNEYQDIVGARYRIAELRQQARILWGAAASLKRDIHKDEVRLISDSPIVRTIIDQTCKLTGVSPEKLFSKNRKNHVAFARMIAVYMLRQMTPLSYPQIGLVLQRDHSTIMHAHNLMRKRMANVEFARTIGKAIQNARAQVAKGLTNQPELYAETNHDSGRNCSIPASSPINDLPIAETQAVASL